MTTIQLANKTYTVAGELPNGVFYLEGPRGGDVHFAKPAGDVYMFFKAAGGAAIYHNGIPVTATHQDLTA